MSNSKFPDFELMINREIEHDTVTFLQHVQKKFIKSKKVLALFKIRLYITT